MHVAGYYYQCMTNHQNVSKAESCFHLTHYKPTNQRAEKHNLNETLPEVIACFRDLLTKKCYRFLKLILPRDIVRRCDKEEKNQ